jgi:hypothetical protein
MASLCSLVRLLCLGSGAMALYVQGKESYVVIIEVKFYTFVYTYKFYITFFNIWYRKHNCLTDQSEET